MSWTPTAYLVGGVVDHYVDAEDGVVLSRKVFEVGRLELYPLGVLAQLGLQDEEGTTTTTKAPQFQIVRSVQNRWWSGGLTA